MTTSDPDQVQASKAQDMVSRSNAHTVDSDNGSDNRGNAPQQPTQDEANSADLTGAKYIIEAEIARSPTWMLVDSIRIAKDSKTPQRYMNALSGSRCSVEEPDLGFAANVLIERVERQKMYMHRLESSMSAEQWKTHFSSPGSGDEAYENYLKQHSQAGTATTPRSLFINNRRTGAVMQPKLSSKLRTISNYEIDLSTEGCDTGSIVITDPHLECLCELGDRFGVDPKIFTEYHRDDSKRRDKDAYSHDFCTLDGWAVDRLDATGVVGSRTKEVVLKRPSRIDSAVLAEALVRITCHRVRGSLCAYFLLTQALILIPDNFAVLILIRTPRKALCRRPQEEFKSIAIPVEGYSYSDWAQNFFCEAWNARRFWDLWTSTSAYSIATGGTQVGAGYGRLLILTWLLALRSFELKLDRLTSKFRALDFELINLPSDAALNQVKERRGQVARMRQDIADVRDHAELRSVILSKSYERCREKYATKEDPNRQPSLTAREKASSSVQEEYNWIDGKAAELMPILNENLQLVIAMISIEQAKRTADQTQIAMDDAQVNRKNSERSTKLAYLAAIYLPLTLATGIFGMNIREIGDEKGPRWWTFILMAAVLTVLTVLFMWLLITRTIAVQPPWKEGWRHFKKSRLSRKLPASNGEAEKNRNVDEKEEDTEEGDGDGRGSAEMSICSRSSV